MGRDRSTFLGTWWLRGILALTVATVLMGTPSLGFSIGQNPYTGDAEAAQEGHQLYLKVGCAGCHGSGGGGGMCPSLTDCNWQWGGDDETLFRLIKGELPQQTMLRVFGSVLTDDQVWKIITWIRFINRCSETTNAIVAGSDSTPATSGTGVITGVVRHASVAQFETVVYIDDDVPGWKPSGPLTAVMDQKDKTFIPHVLPVVVGTKVEFLNSDPFEHNVYSPEGGYDLGMAPQGKKIVYTFKKPGVYTQLCRPHPEMLAFVVVLKNPFFAKTDKEGRFRIEGVPAGTWHLKVWNERLKPQEAEKRYTVEVRAGQEVSVTLEP
ncbi:Cytochrome c-L [bacterium HR11]|nr:Cytochrome c-L [bacterium HR11]